MRKILGRALGKSQRFGFSTSMFQIAATGPGDTSVLHIQKSNIPVIFRFYFLKLRHFIFLKENQQQSRSSHKNQINCDK